MLEAETYTLCFVFGFMDVNVSIIFRKLNALQISRRSTSWFSPQVSKLYYSLTSVMMYFDAKAMYILDLVLIILSLLSDF